MRSEYADYENLRQQAQETLKMRSDYSENLRQMTQESLKMRKEYIYSDPTIKELSSQIAQ